MSTLPLTLSLLVFCFSVPQLVESRGTGAPFGSCLTLTPQHGSQPTQPPMSSPYVINATKVVDESTDKEKVHLVVHSPVKRTPFKGFVLQARYANNPDVIVDGKFLPNEGILSRTYVCKPGEDMMHNVSNSFKCCAFCLFYFDRSRTPGHIEAVRIKHR